MPKHETRILIDCDRAAAEPNWPYLFVICCLTRLFNYKTFQLILAIINCVCTACLRVSMCVCVRHFLSQTQLKAATAECAKGGLAKSLFGVLNVN